MNPITFRILSIQFLLFGLLFLPRWSASGDAYSFGFWEDASRFVHVFVAILDNPAFYGLLMFCTIVFMLSFRDTQKRKGLLAALRSLRRIVVIYSGMFLFSWLVLTYKLMFMGRIFILDAF